MDFENLSATELQRLGQHVTGRLERSIELANGQLVSVSGWLSAALFALNGGGAVATLNIADKLDTPGWASGLFVAGVLFAVLSGVAIQFLIRIETPPAEALLTFWRDVAAEGEMDVEFQADLMKPLAAIHRWSPLPPALGWISGILFVVGATILGIDVGHDNPKHAAVCRHLQQQMLAPHQPSDRSRELFSSFSCHFE